MKGRKPATVAPGTHLLTTAPRVPAWLSKDAKAEWRRVAPILVERGVLTEADLGTLESYVTATARVREAEAVIQLDGAIYMGATGPKRHPAVTTQDAALKTARLLANELGLTPFARSRASMIGGDDGDDLFPLDL